MNITVLTHVDPADGRDAVVDQVTATLGARHDVDVLEVFDDLPAVVGALRQQRPDLVFNLSEMFADNVQGDALVAAVLELLRQPFTGSGAAELFLVQDKGLAKKVLAFDGILYPNFAIFTADADLETGGNLHMPLFVKPLRGDASIGISGSDALVRDSRTLMERVVQIHDEHKDAALAEEYIEGRELYVGVLGNREPEALPPVELDLSGLPDHMPPVADQKVKFDEELGKKYDIVARVAELPDELRARLQKVAVQAYRALRVRDYGRVDLRLTEAGEIYVLEVNANCYLEEKQEFAMAAAAAGYEYPALLERIVQLAVERQGVEPRRPRRSPPRGRRRRAPLTAGTSPSARGSSPAR
ncbi:MAG TPA: D-alanine--D-alanine ligase [Thermoanaerobaculia bacterium]|jgi:D-alanine-D-alanine ligase|nr:D-alanine--D-alanine ligase [Thermoanaerobaculia bacterium]